MCFSLFPWRGRDFESSGKRSTLELQIILHLILLLNQINILSVDALNPIFPNGELKCCKDLSQKAASQRVRNHPYLKLFHAFSTGIYTVFCLCRANNYKLICFLLHIKRSYYYKQYLKQKRIKLLFIE